MQPHHEVWILLFPGVQALDVTGPHEVLSGANRAADELGEPGPRYSLRLVTPGPGGVVTTESGLGLAAEPIPDLGAPTTLIVPGGDGVHAAVDGVRQATARLVAGADRVATVCSGAFLVATTGRADGRRVATHWARARQLAERHPEVMVDPEAIWIRDGDLWSSAGVTAGVDLALAIVEHDLGAQVAQVVARWLVVPLRRPGGQSQFAAPDWAALSPVDPIRHAQQAVLAEPGADHRVEVLAATVGLSARHFSRLFAAEVGQTPARYVERVRVDRARTLLESTDHGLVSVAGRCGFGSGETLRRAFHRQLGVSPDDYRRHFRLRPAV